MVDHDPLGYDKPMNIQRIAPIDVDNIYCATYSAHWAFLTQHGAQEGVITEIEVTTLEDNSEFVIGAKELTNAINDILAGKHAGSYLVNQCMNDVTEWKNDPKHGVPFDSELSDCIIQIACFGEIIYG